MKIAVTYENGQVFQHFGHTEEFKIYTVEDGKVVSSEVIGTNGNGHEALAGFLADGDVEALICGGIGGGAMEALTDAGIEVMAGVSGDVDEAVEAFLGGELISSGVNCDHHDHHHEEEEHGCGHCHEDAEEGGCASGGCSGCSGCGEPQPLFEGKNVGKTVRVHYKGTFNDGTQFDASYDRGEPLEFVCGMGMMIMGFDKAVAEMEVGEIVNVHLNPEEAYGEADPNAIIQLPLAELPGAEELQVGDQAFLQDMYGRPFRVRVTARDEENITFDANHEMAGKELNFQIELVEIVA